MKVEFPCRRVFVKPIFQITKQNKEVTLGPRKLILGLM